MLKKQGIRRIFLNSSTDEAIRFRNWLLGDVLPSIEETGTYDIQNKPNKLNNLITDQNDLNNVVYPKVDINHYHRKPCIYLIHLEKNIYKFGMSGKIIKRWKTHSYEFGKFHLTPQLVNIWECVTSIDMEEIEKSIKLLADQEDIFVDLYGQKEIIQTNNISFIFDKITEYVNDKKIYSKAIIKNKKR